MTVVFVGHFSPQTAELASASSAAGNQVQRRILKELSSQCGAEEVKCFSMIPLPVWPVGPLFSRFNCDTTVAFPSFPNLPAVKHVWFALCLFVSLVGSRPTLVMQYNAYLFENISLLLYRCLFPRTSLILFIQDIHVDATARFPTKRWARSITESAAIWFSRYFDQVVPISDAVIADFGFDPAKCRVFQGAPTDFSERLLKVSAEQIIEDMAVYAGALEPHNGVDRLVDRWIEFDIRWPLHLFGRGSLEPLVKSAAARSKMIVFHGYQPLSIILQWQSRARWNFCFRYSAGLDQRYFFPSKLFNVACVYGEVVTNRFHGIPDDLAKHLCFVSDDLSDLASRLTMSTDESRIMNAQARHALIASNYSWEKCISESLFRART